MYPGEPSEPSELEAEEALDTAREIFRVLTERLPISVQP